MRGCDDRQDAAGIGKRTLHGGSARAKLLAKLTALRVGLGIGIIEEASPDPVGIGVLLPIPTGFKRGLGISAAVASDPRPSASFEGEGLTDLHAVATAETERS